MDATNGHHVSTTSSRAAPTRPRRKRGLSTILSTVAVQLAFAATPAQAQTKPRKARPVRAVPVAVAPVPVAVPPEPPIDEDVEPLVIVRPATPERSGLFTSADAGFTAHASAHDTLVFSGSGLGFRLVAGGMANPSLALFAGLSYFESASFDFRLSMTSLLVGARAYTPSSIYFEGTLGTLRETFDDDLLGVAGTSNTGWMVQIGAGKEWRFDSGLAVGLGARLGGGRVPAVADQNDPVVGQLSLVLGFGFAGSP